MDTRHLKKGLLLISGGFDSAVAGKAMQDVGMSVSALHLSSEPFTDDSPEVKSRTLAKKFGFAPFWSLNVGQEFSTLSEKCSHRYYFVLSKRMMMRVGNDVAKREGFDSLITGESLGQVSSQTLENLSVIDLASSLPVLRPLLGMDKTEIIRRAEALGSFEISKGPELCGVLGPDHPATRCTEERILREEGRVDMSKMIQDILSRH